MFALKQNTTESRLFWSSVVLLFGEILAIRWLGIEVPTVRVFPNLVLLVVLIAASAGASEPQKYRTPLPVLVAALAALFGCVIFAVPLGLAALSIKIGAASFASIGLSIGLLALLVVCLGAVFANVGGVMGDGFSKLPPLRAYGINLAGSILGAALLGCLSLFQLPPPVWILAAGLMCWPIARHKLVPILTVALAVTAATTTLGSKWSPYSKLDVIPLASAAGSVLGKGNYVLNSNNHYFHFALHMLGDEEAAKLHAEPDSPHKGAVEHYFDFLRIPFACAPRHDRVLILGGGSGNDVAYALAHGAKHVDVVEIDPIICGFGKTLHPDKPYIDPRVTLHNEDARTFLRYNKDKFDLIEFAYLDPGSTLSTASFVRVDNFVYTVESIKSAIGHLDTGGLLTLSFATGGKHPVTRRLYESIAQAQGSYPQAYVDHAWDSVLFLCGPTAKGITVEPAQLGTLKAWPQAGEMTATRPATDDWPFLYLDFDAAGMVLYFGILIVAVLMPAWLLTRARQGAITGSEWGNMFFLGQAFMLVETKSIIQLSLFFGATWLVSSVVIICVLLLACFANWLASRIKTTNVLPFYFCLAAALALDLCFHVPASWEINPLVLVGIATLICCLPVLFGGLIFSLCFRQAKAPQLYLSANLLGVAIGGLTENLSLLTGVRGLSIVAMVLYGLSFFALRYRAGRDASSH